MKLVDMGGVRVVHSGEPWTHRQLPCSRQMIAHLERNESLVTWVQVCPTCVHVLCVLMCSLRCAAVGWVGLGPVPGRADRRFVLHNEPAHDEGGLV